jgi:hypothetical protein
MEKHMSKRKERLLRAEMDQHISMRKEILLRAAYDLLKRSTQDHFVREATSIVTRFDDANCDGWCLMEDIASELGLDDDTEPIPLGPEDDS